MNKLWIFGDSFSAPTNLNLEDKYSNWLKAEMNIDNSNDYYWGTLLSKELNLELVNKSIPGCSNTHIITEIIMNINNISKDDYVIIGWTLPTRLSLPAPHEYYLPLITLSNPSAATSLESKYNVKGYSHFYNRAFFPVIDEHIMYWNEIVSNITTHLKSNYNLITWCWVDMDIPNISNHTNHEVHDDHASIIGHDFLKNHFLSLNWGTVFDIYNLNDILAKKVHD